MYGCSIDYLLKDNSTTQQEGVSKDQAKANRSKRLPFIITVLGLMAITFIVFAVPWLKQTILESHVSNDNIESFIEVYAITNYYEIIFCSGYSFLNGFALFGFIIPFAIITLAIFYIFYDKKIIAEIIKIANCSLLALIAIVFFLCEEPKNSSGLAGGYVELILLVAMVITQYTVTPFRALSYDGMPASNNDNSVKRRAPFIITVIVAMGLLLVLYDFSWIANYYYNNSNPSISKTFYSYALADHFEIQPGFADLAVYLTVTILVLAICLIFFDNKKLSYVIKGMNVALLAIVVGSLAGCTLTAAAYTGIVILLLLSVGQFAVPGLSNYFILVFILIRIYCCWFYS